MKKSIFPLLAVVMALSLCLRPGKANAGSPVDEYPKGSINVYVVAAAGGSFDIGVRLLIPFVEKELGVPMNVVNNDVGGGWALWLECARRTADGYSIYTNNFPNFFGLYNPDHKYDVDFSDYQLVANFCSDANMVVTSKESGIETLEQLIEYCNTKPDIIAGVTPFGGDDHLAYVKMTSAVPAMANATPLHVVSITEAIANQLGGFTDIMFCNVGNYDAVKEKCNIICVFTDKRVDLIPDVPTFNECAAELGLGVEVIAGTNRGFWMPTGGDPAIVEKIVSAFEKALNSEELKQIYAKNKFVWNGLTGDDYAALIARENEDFKEILPLLGW